MIWYWRDGTIAVDDPSYGPKWKKQMGVLNRKLGDPKYRRVAETTIGQYWVSTVWIGLDYRMFGEGPPLIFETMVFSPKRKRRTIGGKRIWMLGDEVDRTRYSTEEEALRGHAEMVKRWTKESKKESD